MAKASFRSRRGVATWFLMLLVLLALGGAALAVSSFFLRLPSVAALRSYRPPAASEVFSDEYVKIGEFFKERRIFVRLHDAPPVLVKAFVAAEDSDFFRHKGISFTGILRAMLKNLIAGEVKQGGSTITQQVAKQLLLSPERSFLRKVREAILAYKMERFLSKEQILEIYLNQVYLGHSAYGVQAAAQTYFNKDVVELSLAEAALLAALTKAPSRDNPINDPARAVGRRNYVLRRMLEESYVTKEEAAAAEAAPLEIVRDSDVNRKYAPYFVEHVRRYVIEKYGEEAIYGGGLQIYTTLRARDAIPAQRALRSGLEELDRRQGYRGPSDHLEKKSWEPFLAKLREEQPHEPSDGDENLTALVTEVRDKDGWVYINTGFAQGAIPFTSMRWAREPDPERFWENALIDRPSQALKAGDVIRVRLWPKETPLETAVPKGLTPFILFQEPEVQGALVALDPRNGALRAMVGGYDFRKSEFNRVVQARRQPGSAFKPVIYSAALDHGFTAASIIVDSPIVYDDPTHEFKWKPKNYEGDFQGNTIFRDCLIKSRNVPTIKIVQQLGMDTLSAFGRRVGITSELAQDFSAALGSSTVVPIELVSVYAMFPARGRKVNPVFLKRVVDRDGRVLERGIPDDPALDPEAQLALVAERSRDAKLLSDALEIGKDVKAQLPPGYVVSPQTAFIMTHLLKEVIRSGTGTRAAAINRPAAGKTGTTNDNYDAWFIGFTPELVAGVWVGFDEVRTLGVREMGGASATPIWLDYMQQALKDVPATDFPVPPGVIFAQIDPKTGKVATSKTKDAMFEAFREGTEPTETSEEADKKKTRQNFFLNE